MSTEKIWLLLKTTELLEKALMHRTHRIHLTDSYVIRDNWQPSYNMVLYQCSTVTKYLISWTRYSWCITFLTCINHPWWSWLGHWNWII